jgi:HSP20 family protein
MALTLWKPMNDLWNIHDETDKVFEDFFGKWPTSLRGRNGGCVPVVDISETDNQFAVRAEIPGVTEKDVNVSITDNVLTLKGEKKRETEEKRKNYHRVERSYGSFQRSFTLPKNLQTEKTTATFKNGILTVSIPKSEAVKPKEVQISVE